MDSLKNSLFSWEGKCYFLEETSAVLFYVTFGEQGLDIDSRQETYISRKHDTDENWLHEFIERNSTGCSAGIYTRSCFDYVELIASQLTGNDSLSVELRHCP